MVRESIKQALLAGALASGVVDLPDIAQVGRHMHHTVDTGVEED